MNATQDARPPRAVRISSTPDELAGLGPLLETAEAGVGDVPALLALAKDLGETAPKPGSGRTAFLWEILASVTAGRILEPHLDAAAILAQAAGAVSDSVQFDGTWGVFAAEAPGLTLDAKE